MVNVIGIVVSLQTESRNWAGTNDHLWIGVFGKGGGREFALDVHNFDDFEEGTTVKYWFGEVWEGTQLAGAKKPWHSQVGERWNNPQAWQTINLEKVDYVYLKKGGTRIDDHDDAYLLENITVILYGPEGHKRTFRQTKDIRLSNESGLKVWLVEQ